MQQLQSMLLPARQRFRAPAAPKPALHQTLQPRQADSLRFLQPNHADPPAQPSPHLHHALT